MLDGGTYRRSRRKWRNGRKCAKNLQAKLNLGAVYETVVAQELKAHGKKLFYYDNRHKGEVDFLIDDFDSLSVVPIEVKSGRDYRIHSAIDNLLKANENAKGIVLSNSPNVVQKGAVLYLPIYFAMFL